MRGVSIIVFILTFGVSATTMSATIGASPNIVDALVGGTILIDVVADFTDEATVGGGMDLFYNSGVITYNNFSFASTELPLDDAFSRVPDDLGNKLEGLAFGNFAGIGTAGIVGTLSFTALAPGSFDLTMAVTTDPLKGGDFISAVTFAPMTVDFGSANITVNEVPLPAAAWFFGSALIGLAGIKRRSC